MYIENSTGYPTGDNRAINNGTGHTTAVDASCDHCDKTSLRNVQVRRRGTRAPPSTHTPRPDLRQSQRSDYHDRGLLHPDLVCVAHEPYATRVRL